ncbi:MAG: hypothetical protein WC382_12785 [Methanoregulaceae archaeon]|jgi:hypothetical protein
MKEIINVCRETPDEWYFSLPGYTGVKAGNSRVSGKYFFHSPVIGLVIP